MTTAPERDGWTEPIGAPLDRVEAASKVTGRAVYTGDVRVPGAVNASLVTSRLASARIRSIDTAAAERAPGVLAVITHENRPEWTGSLEPEDGRWPLDDDRVYYGGQFVAVVVAETLQQAEHAVTLVDIDYEPLPVVPTLAAGLNDLYPSPHPAMQYSRGDAEAGFTSSAVRIDSSFTTPDYSHAPIEPSAAIAQWDGDRLTVHASNQYVYRARGTVAAAFGIPEENITFDTSLIGGAFGCKIQVWGYTLLTVMAARVVDRPVRLVLTRKQHFTTTGHMAGTRQRVRIGADRDGRMRAIVHETVNGTSVHTDYTERAPMTTPDVYAVDSVLIGARITKVNKGSPASMRTPGDLAGQFALESAIDELAYATNSDPVELRRRHFANADLSNGEPWTSNGLPRCYDLGVREFGWERRDPRPGSMRDGDELIGYGMAGGCRHDGYDPARARIELRADGRADLYTSAQEIGGGTLTILVQIAASHLGVDPGRITIHSGSTAQPMAAPTYGSAATGNTGSAVLLAGQAVRSAAIRLAIGDTRSPLHGAAEDAVDVEDGRMFLTARPRTGETYTALLRRHGIGALSETGQYDPVESGRASASFAAHFTEVRIDSGLRRVRVVRHLSVIDCGRVMNAKTASNQARGGIIFAIGGALMEQITPDPVTGVHLSPALTDYHFPVHADVGDIQVRFVELPDDTHPLGTKGLGEVCSIGVAASVANAVYHATGRRVRDLPITPERLLHA
ncbi:xanthine dehydrogenase family protein molybdopterin-binding subunit [Streptomyces sp. NPDC048290]|uniref:xanthine dehydrogenase family protein molybdopterin-binding subunit n=1 Tax=Streptomyces sp. NPDC048290 TaxID=3155811 RepID=UPI0034220A54